MAITHAIRMKVTFRTVQGSSFQMDFEEETKVGSDR